MIRADMIPDEAWHTAMSTYHKTIKKRPGSAWQEAIAAALSAWPGVKENKVQVPDDSDEIRYTLKTTGIILPLPQQEKGGQ